MPNRQLIDQATRHQVHIERLKSGDVAQFDRFLRRMERHVVGQIAAENVTDWTLKRLNQQLSAIRGYLSEQYHGPVHDLWRQQIMDLAQYEAGFEIRSMSQVIQYDFTLPSSQQLTSAVFSRPLSVRGADGGKLLETFYDTWTDAQIGRVDGMIRMGYAQGQTTPQIVRNLRDFGGVFEQNRRGFEMMARTSLQHAANEARQATWERNSDIITGVRWVSALDDRTTTQCFVGSTPVSSVGELKNIFRSKYSGEIVIVTTASGKKIEGTPNHPILTPDGFLFMGELDPCKHVVYSVRDDLVGIHGGQNVSVPTPIGELFDSLNKPSVSDIVSKRPSAVDFYGDGMAMNGEVNILRAKGHLRLDAVASISQSIKNKFLRLCHFTGGLFRHGLSAFNILRWFPSGMAPEFVTKSLNDSPNPLFSAPMDDFGDLSGALPLSVKRDSKLSIGDDFGVTFSAFQSWHDAVLLEKRGHCSSGDAVFNADRSSGPPAPVFLDNVVSVVRENRNCHVYTLSCGQGFYIAGGIAVKNCQALDGQVFPIDKGPRPPAHVGCRSTVVPELDRRFSALDEGGTRAARDPETGEIERVPARQTYYGWLNDQPPEVQDSIIGPARGKLLRDGGLSAQRFADMQLGRRFEPLTLDQMRQLEPLAFKRAGL